MRDNQLNHSTLEFWKQIPDYPDYWVSSWGRVLSLRKSKNIPRYLKPVSMSTGYYCVTLVNIEGKRQWFIHRLVLLAFEGDMVEHEVNHIDGCKTNNHISNLEYVTSHENHLHAAKIGLKARGERNGDSRLKESQVRSIRQLYGTGQYTYVALGKQFGISGQAIRAIIKHKLWKYLD